MVDTVWLCCIVVLILQANAFSYTGERSIRSSVLSSFSYDRMSRPNETTTARVGFNILSINDVDIMTQELIITGWFTVDILTQELIITGWFTLLWHDERLMWNPSVYDGTSYIHALETEIWKPEVLVTNAKEDVGLISDDHLIYRIKYTGDVEWEPLMKFTVHCSIDVTFFPFDTQKCYLELTSWGLPNSELILTKLWNNTLFGEYEENGSWDIVSSDVEEAIVVEHSADDTEEYFSQLNFGFVFRRKPGNYVLNTLYPIICSSVLMPLTILIPIVSGERLTSQFLVMVMNATLMSVFVTQIPDIATTTSILGIYLSYGFCIDCVFIIVSVILTRVHHQSKDDPVGRCHGIIIFVLKILTCYFDPPIPESEAEEVSLVSIPTDDLKKIERSTFSKRGNAVNPELEDGFTEHVKLKMPTLPPIISRPGTSKRSKMDNDSKQCNSKDDNDSNSESGFTKPKPKSRELTWDVVASVWDRLLLLAALGVKLAYNLILIGNMLGNPV